MRSEFTVYLVDDNEAIRDSLSWALRGVDFDVKAFSSASHFLKNYQATKPACLVLDVRMPEMSGIELQKHLLEAYEKEPAHFSMPIIFMTGHGDVNIAVQTMKKGAVDFLEKPFENETLFSLIDQAMEKAIVQHNESLKILQHNKLLAQLTPREREVLDYVVAGYLNKQVADKLNISIKTVEAHRSNVMSKLGVRTVAEAVQIVVHSASGVTVSKNNSADSSSISMSH